MYASLLSLGNGINWCLQKLKTVYEICTIVNVIPSFPEQITDASSLWSQFWLPHPPCRHFVMDLSLPTHCTSSSHMGPLPEPNLARGGALKASWNPSSRQTTCVSFMSHLSSQTVPQLPLWNISTLPSPSQSPSANLRRFSEFAAKVNKLLIYN